MSSASHEKTGSWINPMEEADFRKKVKEQLKQLTEKNEPPEDLGGLFKNKIIEELRSRNLPNQSLQQFDDLINYFLQKIQQPPGVDKSITVFRITISLFSIYLAINLFKDPKICKKTLLIGLIDPLYFYAIFSDQEILALNRRYNIYENDEVIPVYQALKKIHFNELPTIIHYGLRPNGENSKTQEILLGLIHTIFKDQVATELDLIQIKPDEKSDQLSEKICYDAIHREVLLFILLERFSLLTFFDVFSNIDFLANNKYEIAVESLLIHAPMAEKIGFRWAKGRIEDGILKFWLPAEFGRIREILSRTLTDREKFILEQRQIIEKTIQASNTKAVEEFLKFTDSKLAWIKKRSDASPENVLFEKYLTALHNDFKRIQADLQTENETGEHPAWFSEAAKLSDDEFHQLYLLRFKISNSPETEEIQKILNQLRERLRDSNLVAIKSILGRPKNIYSIYRKEHERQLPPNQHHDLIGLRIIVENSKLFQKILLKCNKLDPPHSHSRNIYAYYCYNALALLQSKFKQIEKFKDFIKTPKCNGYQSLHIVYETGDINFPLLEIQIRDEEMESFAEYGLAAHWVYERAGKKSIIVNGNSTNWDILREKYNRQFEKNITVMIDNHDIQKIPTHSTALDLAYILNPEQGQRCNKVWVNNQLVSFDTILKDGDRVKIDCSATQKPNSKWLRFVNNVQVQMHIRSQLQDSHNK